MPPAASRGSRTPIDVSHPAASRHSARVVRIERV
jgi:hypothetical protein